MWMELVLKLHDDTTDDDIKCLQDEVDAVIAKHRPSVNKESIGIVADWNWDH